MAVTIEEIKYNGNESNEKDADLTDLREMAVSREQQQLIDNISEGSGGSGGGGGDLPTPTVDDVGKAVVVDEEGKYALGEAPSCVLFLTAVVEGTTITLNGSYNDVITAVGNGKIVCFTLPEDTGGLTDYISVYSLIATYKESDNYNASFQAGSYNLVFSADSASTALVLDGGL